jgi:hypothetical protein
MDFKFQIIIFDQKSGKMKKYAATAGVFFSLMLCACSHVKYKDPIKVMTMNVRYDNPEDSINAWPNRIPLFVRFI